MVKQLPKKPSAELINEWLESVGGGKFGQVAQSSSR
jgi:hypothetical protein